MTMGEHALAMQYDNAPTVPNPDQADADHDGIGDVIDGAALTASEIQVTSPASDTAATLTATLLNSLGQGIPNQTVIFYIDTDGDDIEEQFSALTGPDGIATVVVNVTGGPGKVFVYRTTWDGGPVNEEALNIVRVGDPVPMRIIGVNHTPGVSFEVTVEGLNPIMTYRLSRSPDLLSFPERPVEGFVPEDSVDTLIDSNPPAGRAFYRVEKE
jgi:hypothetical protein